MRLSELLTPGLVKIGLESTKKSDLFEEMVQLFLDAGLIHDRLAAIRALTEREAKMSTGIARWIGLPHGKLPEATGILLAIGTSRQGIEYDSLDGEAVHVVVMVFAQVGHPGLHIEALAEIARLFCIPGFTERVREATTAAELLRLIKGEE
jgi:mannitol/fructose-specific phosphotransferase system IIA component (Ntr-type)